MKNDERAIEKLPMLAKVKVWTRCFCSILDFDRFKRFVADHCFSVEVSEEFSFGILKKEKSIFSKRMYSPKLNKRVAAIDPFI